MTSEKEAFIRSLGWTDRDLTLFEEHLKDISKRVLEVLNVWIVIKEMW